MGENTPQLRIVSRTETASDYDIRILIIDQHELFVEGVRTLMRNEQGMKIIAHAADRGAALEAAAEQPDVILLELTLQDRSTLDFIPELAQIAEGARILVVTGEGDSELHVRAVHAGAMGIVSKKESCSSLFKAIRKIHNGEVWLRRSLVSSVFSGLSQTNHGNSRDPHKTKIASLTPREFEVVALIAEGLRNKQIGDRLYISDATVRHYLTSIFDKLEVADRLELIIYAYQHGLAQIAPAV